MYYGIEKAAEIRQREMLREADRQRLIAQCGGQPFSLRRPLGNLLVRVGSRLNEEPRHLPQLASAGDAA